MIYVHVYGDIDSGIYRLKCTAVYRMVLDLELVYIEFVKLGCGELFRWDHRRHTPYFISRYTLPPGGSSLYDVFSDLSIQKLNFSLVTDAH